VAVYVKLNSMELIGKITKIHICKWYPNKMKLSPTFHTLEIHQVLKRLENL